MRAGRPPVAVVDEPALVGRDANARAWREYAGAVVDDATNRRSFGLEP